MGGVSRMVHAGRHARRGSAYAALGIAVAVFVPAGPALGDEHGAGKGDSPATEAASHPSQNASAAVPIPPKPYVYPYSCTPPKDAEQDNLCIEREAAEQAHRSADWARDAFWVGVASAAGLVLTLIATAWAAWAAQRGASAAIKGADIAERAVTELETPFLFPVLEGQGLAIQDRLLRLQYPDDPAITTDLVVEFTIKNYGRTAAIPNVVSAVLYVGQVDDRQNDKRASFIFEPILDSDTSLAHKITRSTEEPLNGLAFANINAKMEYIFFRGAITYYDIFGNFYEQKFCLRWDKDAKDFMAWGDGRNGRRRVREAKSEKRGGGR